MRKCVLHKGSGNFDVDQSFEQIHLLLYCFHVVDERGCVVSEIMWNLSNIKLEDAKINEIEHT